MIKVFSYFLHGKNLQSRGFAAAVGQWHFIMVASMHFKAKIISLAVSGLCLSTAPAVADAATMTARGKIVMTQGHELPACRVVQLRRTDGVNIWFRTPATGTEDGIMAVSLTAVSTGKDVEITYDPAVTSGCGTEPKIQVISIFAPGF